MKVGRGLCFVVALTAVLQIAGCGSTPTATPVPPPDAQAMLRAAVSQVLDLKSAAFNLEHQAGSTILLPGLAMKKAFGVVEIPDKLRLTVEAELESPRSYVEINVIIIGGQAYITDFFTGQWREERLEALPVNFVDFGRTLAEVIDAVQDPKSLRTKQLDGREFYLIDGRVQSEDLAALVPGAGEGFEVVLEIWVDQEEGMLRRVVITGKVVPTDITDSVRLLTLDDINAPVTITLPK